MGKCLVGALVLASFAPCVVEAQPPQPSGPMYTVPSGGAPQAPPMTVPTSPSAPASVAYVPAATDAPPARAEEESAVQERPQRGLPFLIAGAAVLGAGWLYNILVGAFAGGSAPEWEAFRFGALLPIGGPWLQLGLKPTRIDQDEWGTWLIIDGLVQAVGAVVLVTGIVMRIEDDEAAASTTLVVVPSGGPDGAGLRLLGTF